MIDFLKKRNRSRVIFIVIVLVSCFMWVSVAKATLIFDFSFTNDHFQGAPGTVTGQIFGLADNNSGQAATSVIITSIPAIFGAPGSSPAPGHGDNAVAWAIQSNNTFDVVGGVITFSIFKARTAASSIPGFTELFLSLDPLGTTEAWWAQDYTGDAALNFFAGNSEILWDQDFSGQGFSQGSNLHIGGSLPAPTTFLLLGIGLAGLAGTGIRRRRKKKAVD